MSQSYLPESELLELEEEDRRKRKTCLDHPSDPEAFRGVPFAPAAPEGSFWPVVTKDSNKLCVSFLSLSAGHIGRAGRRFGADRSSGKNARHHAAIDLTGNPGDEVVACEDGEIVYLSKRFLCVSKVNRECNRHLGAIMVRHQKVVVNYGEVAHELFAKYGIARGVYVKAGHPIGKIGLNGVGQGMLHFETYAPEAAGSFSWKRGATPSPLLRNPTKYLLSLQVQARRGGGAVTPSAPGWSVGDIFETVQQAVRAGLITMQIATALLSGLRDEVQLTSMIFYGRHPERGGKPIDPKREKPQAQEWVDIRNRIVKPLLARLGKMAKPA